MRLRIEGRINKEIFSIPYEWIREEIEKVLDYVEFEGKEVLRKELSIVESDLKSQKDGGLISERMEMIEIEIEGLKRRIDELERKISDLQKKIENLEEEIRKLEEERKKKESEKENLLNKWFVRKRAERVKKIEEALGEILEKIEIKKRQKEELERRKLELGKEKLESKERIERKEKLFSFYKELEEKIGELNERIKGGLSISRKELRRWKESIEKIKKNLQVEEEIGREIVSRYIDEYIKMVEIMRIKKPSLIFLLTEAESFISKGEYEEERTGKFLDDLEKYKKELENLAFLKEEGVLKILLEKIEEAKDNLKNLLLHNIEE